MSSLSNILARAILTAGLFSVHAAQAGFLALHSFTGSDGANPFAAVTFSENESVIYGTTLRGGVAGKGTVYKLDLLTLRLTTLHSFTGSDGATPFGTLVLDKRGVLFGTTSAGGGADDGTVFKLDPKTGSFATVHSFDGIDGASPMSGLARDTNGMFFGTTFGGGATNVGTVFELDPVSEELTTLFDFTADALSVQPSAGVVIGKTGTLFGTTSFSSADAFCPNPFCGSVYALDPATGVLTTLHSFSDGSGVLGADITFDEKGMMFGVTEFGVTNDEDANELGSVFKLDPTTGAFTTLHNFDGADGVGPEAALIFDRRGQLFGTTNGGGEDNSGVVFRLNPRNGNVTVLHSFTNGRDGANPAASLVPDRIGNLFGTTSFGGENNDGTVFVITP
jgi:uncharacterized repeat protein (TIGR03803 family)